MKTFNSIEEVEAYLGSQEYMSTETPLSIWNARMILLLAKRNQTLLADTQPDSGISSIGLGIVNMATGDKCEYVRKLVQRLEGYVVKIENGKYVFNTKNYKPGVFYQIFAEIVIHLKTIQMAFYEYMAEHSNLEASPESMKNGVNYLKRTKGGNRND